MRKEVTGYFVLLGVLGERCGVVETGLRGEGACPGVAIEMAKAGTVFTLSFREQDTPAVLVTGSHHKQDSLKSIYIQTEASSLTAVPSPGCG